jgi:hypothetical protein
LESWYGGEEFLLCFAEAGEIRGFCEKLAAGSRIFEAVI